MEHTLDPDLLLGLEYFPAERFGLTENAHKLLCCMARTPGLKEKEARQITGVSQTQNKRAYKELIRCKFIKKPPNSNSKTRRFTYSLNPRLIKLRLSEPAPIVYYQTEEQQLGLYTCKATRRRHKKAAEAQADG